MHFYSVLVFLLIASKTQCVNLSHETFNACFRSKDDHLFVPENSSFLLDLSLQQHGLNCTIEFTSHSSKLNFQFNSLNLPFDNKSKTCLDSVTVSNFCLNENQTGAMCQTSDLPANGLVVTTSPGVVSLSSRCTPTKCNYSTSSGYKFEIVITPNFENVTYSYSKDNHHNWTCNINSENPDTEDTTAIIYMICIIASCVLALLMAAACYFGRKFFCQCVYSMAYRISMPVLVRPTPDIVDPIPLPPMHASGRDNAAFETLISTFGHAETAV